MIMVKSVLNNVEAIKLEPGSSNLGASFISVFVLTISSPMTIFLWTSIFTAKAIENNYSKRDFFVFGLGTGLATLVFMGMAVITLSLLKTSIPLVVIQVLNLIVGGLLILYGLIRLKRLFSR